MAIKIINTTVIDNSLNVFLSSGTAAAPSISTSSDTNTGIFFPAADTLAQVTAGVERARITSLGEILFGTTGVPNGTSIYGSGFELGGTGNRMVLRLATSATTNQLLEIFYNPNGEVGSIGTNATAATFNTTSDYRLKENIQPMTGALARIAALKPCTYTWKVDGSAGEGFIAHELAEVVPQCVTGRKDEVDENGNPIYQGVDVSFIIPILAAAIQEQQAMIEELQAEVAALKALKA